MESLLIENSLSHGPKDSSTPKVTATDRPERGQALKETTNGNRHGSQHGKKDDMRPKTKRLFDFGQDPIKIYTDNTSKEECRLWCSRTVQTDDSLLETYMQNKQQADNISTDSGHLSELMDPEAYDLMVNATIPDRYWKEVAEQRRVALNDTLEENEKLSAENSRLKEENRRLSDLAFKAEYLERMLKSVLSEGESEDETEEQDPSPCLENNSNPVTQDTDLKLDPHSDLPQESSQKQD